MNPQSRTQPKAGKTEVLLSTEYLLSLKSQITALEVKNDLRDHGYIAYETDVAYWMNVLAKENNWVYTVIDDTRVYHVAPNPKWLEDLLNVCDN